MIVVPDLVTTAKRDPDPHLVTKGNTDFMSHILLPGAAVVV